MENNTPIPPETPNGGEFLGAFFDTGEYRYG